jgi:hypothetical protein
MEGTNYLTACYALTINSCYSYIAIRCVDAIFGVLLYVQDKGVWIQEGETPGNLKLSFSLRNVCCISRTKCTS